MAKNQNWVKSLSTAVNLGTSVAAAIGGGLLGGKWLDGKLDTAPWLMILGLLVGIITAGKMVWSVLMADASDNPPAYREKTEGDREP